MVTFSKWSIWGLIKQNRPGPPIPKWTKQSLWVTPEGKCCEDQEDLAKLWPSTLQAATSPLGKTPILLL